MLKKGLLIFSFAMLFANVPIHAQDAKTVEANVAKAMGADQLKTVQYSGTGYWYTFEQNYKTTDAWPKFTLRSYSRTLDFQNGAFEEKASYTQFEPNERGGGFVPLKGALNQDAFLSGDAAWNAGGPGGAGNPQPGAVDERQVWLALTPYGFLKAAMAADATVGAKKVKGMTVVSFTFKGKYKMNGYVDGQNMISKVETWIPQPILGDMPISAEYSDYKDFGGIKFPMKIVETEGESVFNRQPLPILDLTVTNVVPNAPVNIAVPAAAQNAKVQPIRVVSMPLADGVWLLRAGIQSLGVEFKDYSLVVDAGPDEERAQAVIDEMKKLAPNKPIKYIVNTHHHLDHSSGLRTFVAEGATIITGGQENKTYWEKVFKLPHTIEPDRLAKNPRPLSVIAVKDKYVLTDGSRTMEFYLLGDNTHEPGSLISYLPLPNQKIALIADAIGGVAANPPRPGAPPPANVNNISLGDNARDALKRRGLEVTMFVPSHAQGTSTMADLDKQIEAQHAQIEAFDKANAAGSN
jgi:glyoxylase-like metal-dependent hydrolase (beta-lactamase superfamily II)